YLLSLASVWQFGDGELEDSPYTVAALLAASLAGPLGFVMFARMAAWLPHETSARAAYAGRGVCFGLALACVAMNFLHPAWVIFYYFVPGTAPLAFASLAILHFAYRPFEPKRSLAAWATVLVLASVACGAIAWGAAIFADWRTDINERAFILLCGQASACLLLGYRSWRLGRGDHGDSPNTLKPA
ncbi:MAG TPA: hypothetical protein VHB99_09825, partial [Pirellulales bacterium]|nr:hypothetical protein [Pirellulales bacterium]